MEDYSDILQFARDLYAYNSEAVWPDDKENLDPNRLLHSADNILYAFEHAFVHRFLKVHKKLHTQVLDTEEQFLIYTIPRCLKLVDDDHYYFSFMLVASFIQGLVIFFECEKDCYRFVGTAYKCLAAVFKRRFEETFEDNGGWRGLENFLEEDEDWFSQTLDYRLSVIMTRFDLAHTRSVFQLIKECDVAQDEFFSLNEYELSLIALDDPMAVDAEINRLIAESEDSSLQIERDTQKDCEIDDNFSESVSHEGNFVSKFPSKPSNTESSSDSDSFSESESAESREETSIILGEEERSYSDDSMESEFSIGELFSVSSYDSESEPIKSTMPISGQERNAWLRIQYPKKYGKTDSERMCKCCGKMCYEYAKYFIKKHRLEIRP